MRRAGGGSARKRPAEDSSGVDGIGACRSRKRGQRQNLHDPWGEKGAVSGIRPSSPGLGPAGPIGFGNDFAPQIGSA